MHAKECRETSQSVYCVFHHGFGYFRDYSHQIRISTRRHVSLNYISVHMHAYLAPVPIIKFQNNSSIHFFNFHRSTVTEVGNINTWDFARPGAIQAIGIMSFGNICSYLCFILNTDLHNTILRNIFNKIHTNNT